MSDSKRKIIIELTGVPGAGKSTFCNSISSDNILLFSDEIVLRSFMNGAFHSSKLAKVILILFCLKNFSYYSTYIRTAFNFILKMRSSLYKKLSLFVNIMLKIGRYEYATQYLSEEIILFDEGISHGIFNLTDYNRMLHCEDLFDKLPNELLSSIDLFILSNDESVIYKQLSVRGHKRVDSSNKEQLKKFIKQNNLVLDSIIYKNSNRFNSVNILKGTFEEKQRTFENEIKRFTKEGKCL